jgi:hypothetical protein
VRLYTEDSPVLILLLKLIVLYGLLAAILYGLGFFIHRALYESLPDGMRWRPAAAAGVVWVVALAGPALLKHAGVGWPLTFNDIVAGNTTAAAGEDLEFPELIVPQPDGREVTYRLSKGVRALANTRDYRNDAGQPVPDNAATLIGVTADKQRVTFEAERANDGYLAVPRRYKDEQGRVMTYEDLGRLPGRPSGTGFGLGLFAFLLYWGAWFVALWLVLQVALGHALFFSLPLAFAWVFLLNILM